MTFEVQTLSQGAQKQFILRTSGAASSCIFILPIKVSVSSNNEEGVPPKLVSNEAKHIKIFNFQESVHDSAFIIKNLAYHSEDEYFKIVQQYQEKTLFSVNIDQISYAKKVKIVLKIAGIINYAHQQNICLRSLRPEILSFQQNNSDINVRIIWMDEALKLKNGKTETWEPVSQISQFSAPEILAKKSNSKSADIWSLGAIFFHLLFGNSMYRIHYINNKLCINYPDKTPYWLIRILNQLLQEDPNQRCDIGTAISYFKSLYCCAETAQKMIPKH